MIYIRADANPNIGMGHIMRCLSIADAISIFDNDITFVLADDGVHNLISDSGYKAVVLHTDYKSVEAELCSWPSTTPDIIIVDSYYITADYLRSLKDRVGKKGKLVYIDDLASFPYPVDVLVDYNAYAKLSTYEELYRNTAVEMPKFILGPNYAPLRAMFRSVPRKVQIEKTENILISTGGSDELHLALALIQYLMNRGADEKIYHFLLGAMNTDKERIRDIANGRVVLHENVSDMKSLISSCDLVVSAAGSTLYEICACGVPLITYSLADNQIPGAEAFSSLGLAVNIGDLRDPNSIIPGAVMSGELDEGSCERIFTAIEELSADYEKRCEVGARMQEMIDGFGADRIVREIVVPRPTYPR